MMIKTVAELNAAREQAKELIALRVGADKVDGKVRKNVMVCGGTGCTSSGSPALVDVLNKELAARVIADEIKVVCPGCFGLCAIGPIMIVYPEGTFYSMVTPESIPTIVEQHLIGGKPVEELEYHEQSGDHHLASSLFETRFYE